MPADCGTPADKGSTLRTRFTTAHELVHLILHTDVIPALAFGQAHQQELAAACLHNLADGSEFGTSPIRSPER